MALTTRFISGWGNEGIFPSATMSRLTLRPTQLLVQGIAWAPSLVVKKPEHEGDDSLPFHAKVKNVWSYTSTPPYISSWCGD
jgi:hypothetical protein